MSSSRHSNFKRLKCATWENLALGVLLAAIGILSGCGGYHAPMGGSMPGQPPRTYPMQHRTLGLDGRLTRAPNSASTVTK